MERGTLRIYLGAAPGVGKTYAMLGEGHRRRNRGADVVVGIVETHGRTMTATQLAGLEVLPRRNVEHRGTTLSELDVDAVLARRPDVVLIDEYAHTNAPGSPNEKRWQDIDQILDGGIDVITTVNIQHLESLNDVVLRITGVPQTETLPDRTMRVADQIELVDMSPEALRRRMAHGNVYPAERVDAALANFFRPGNLGALRELALLWVADRVEEHLGDYLERHDLHGTWETRERVIVGLSGAAGSETVIRRAARIARRVGGELIGVHVSAADGRNYGSGEALAAQFALLRSLGGSRREIVGDDPVASLADVGRALHATQIVIGTTRQSRWERLWRGSFATRLGQLASDIDIHIVAHGGIVEPGNTGHAGTVHPGTGHPGAGASAISPRPRQARWATRRRLWALAMLAAGVPALTLILHLGRDHVELTTNLLCFLLLVMAVAVAGGRILATFAAIESALVVNWFFVEPRYTLTVDDADDLVALIVFTIVGFVVGALVDRVAVQATSAQRARSEAAILARTAAMLAADPDPVAHVMVAIRDSFALDGARLTQADADATTVIHDTGDRFEPTYLFDAGVSNTGVERTLLVGGRVLTADDQRILTTLSAQLGVGIDRQHAMQESRRADELASIDRARIALLRAVSHDLRTPLATIKALASGMLDTSVSWRPEQIAEMNATIDQEADRLNRLIGNLLDASRLETGTLAVHLQPVSLDRAVETSLRSIGPIADEAAVDIAPTIPPAFADPLLLERALANLLENAYRHSPPDTVISVTAAHIAHEVHICVIDRGSGIPHDRRRAVLAPFQRLDDTSPNGVGLGLAIVDGFVRAMHGRLHLDDTPGGGLTATICLPAVQPAAESNIRTAATVAYLAPQLPIGEDR